MPFESIQIPVSGQGAVKEALNVLLRSGSIVSVRKEIVVNAEDSFGAFCIQFLDGVSDVEKGRGGCWNQSGPRPSGTDRVNRGGGWNNNAINCRAANRNNNTPGNTNNNMGFRPARSSDQQRRRARA
jgi:hypothetical protein